MADLRGEGRLKTMLPAGGFDEMDGLQNFKRYSLNDMLHEAISKHGLEAVAEEIGVDKGNLSRFKNGESGLPLAKLEKLMASTGLVLIHEKRYRRLMYTIITLSEFLKESIGW